MTNSDNIVHPPAAGEPAEPGLLYILRLWFGVTLPVSRGAYAASGCGLMLLKYGIEALAVWVMAGAAYWPWDFVNPLLTMRQSLLQSGPLWLGWWMFFWSLPFLWIAISMSVRRGADAGRSPWWGLAVLVPLVNLLVMVLLALAPTSRLARWSPRRESEPAGQNAKSAALAVGISLFAGAAMMIVSVYLFANYGAALFLGTPLMMGATAGFLFNRPTPRGYGASAGLGLASVALASVGLLLFALEGFICIAMALPLLVPLGALGGVLGKAIADSTRHPPRDLMAALLALPMLAGGEALLSRSDTREVMTAVEIDAPPEIVWQNVVGFPELSPPTEWYFRLGIACPQRARFVGSGVGATRYCEFTTGTFVEPITAWDEPRRLAFDVTEQPEPMFELTPYKHVHPPHLNGFLRSQRGEFRMIALANGRTRLEGRTWYDFRMFPQTYWTLWSDLLIHRIHERVLVHIKGLSEGGRKSR